MDGGGDKRRGEEHALKSLAGGNLALQVALLIVQVLQLQVQHVDLVAGLGSLAPRLAGLEVGSAVQAAQVGKVGVEQLLLPRDLGEDVSGDGAGRVGGGGLGDEVDEGLGLLPGGARRVDDRGQRRVGDVRVEGHGWVR